MKKSKGCSTPCRSPGSLQTHSRHRWCHSPCHRASHSRHIPPTRSSSRNTTRRPHRSHMWHNPARCYTESGTHRRGRPEYSEHNSLQGEREWVKSGHVTTADWNKKALILTQIGSQWPKVSDTSNYFTKTRCARPDTKDQLCPCSISTLNYNICSLSHKTMLVLPHAPL